MTMLITRQRDGTVATVSTKMEQKYWITWSKT